MKPGQASLRLNTIAKLYRRHQTWLLLQLVLSSPFIFAVANKMKPMWSDETGRDALPGLFPNSIEIHYNLFLAFGILAILASEWLRRRFYKKHENEFEMFR